MVLAALIAPTQLFAKEEAPQAVDAGIAAPAATAGISSTPAPAPRSAPGAGPTAEKAAAGSVTIKDFDFGPATITIHAGDTVTWTNKGPTAHSATADDGSFDTGTFAAGGARSHTFSAPGTFPYHCAPHPFMTATVKVLASSGGAGQSKSGGSSGSGSSASPSASAPAATAAPATASPSSGSSASGSLASTGFDPLPPIIVGVLLLAAGVALKGARRV